MFPYFKIGVFNVHIKTEKKNMILVPTLKKEKRKYMITYITDVWVDDIANHKVASLIKKVRWLNIGL